MFFPLPREIFFRTYLKKQSNCLKQSDFLADFSNARLNQMKKL